MKNIYLLLAAAIVAVGTLLYLGSRAAAPDASGERLQAVASFYPLYFFASTIGGDRAEVYNLTPAGTEPHDYEPTARELARLQASRLLLLNGAGLEAWAADIQTVLGAGAQIKAVKVGEGLAAENADPHVWLSPPLAKRETEVILEEFVRLDPRNREYYERNAAALAAKLDDLDQAYRVGLANCGQRTIVTSHAAFGHLAAEYGLHQVPITGLSPEAEPSTEELAHVADFVRANKVRYIFFESLVSPKLAQTIARETGTQTLTLDPLEGLSEAQTKAGLDYFTQMEANLANLKLALACAP